MYMTDSRLATGPTTATRLAPHETLQLHELLASHTTALNMPI
ncbi:hypothetical protein [Paenibacillus elgii]|nr:hypothetical protein [Paenibacillus elgii]